VTSPLAVTENELVALTVLPVKVPHPDELGLDTVSSKPHPPPRELPTLFPDELVFEIPVTVLQTTPSRLTASDLPELVTLKAPYSAPHEGVGPPPTQGCCERMHVP